jgi:predicted nucleotidyltransferase
MSRANKNKNYGDFVTSSVFYNIIKSISGNIVPLNFYCHYNLSDKPCFNLAQSEKNDKQNAAKIAKKDNSGYSNFQLGGVAKNQEEVRLKLNIAFVAFYGSRNYGLETIESDYDFFIVYYPNFHNFFHNKFIRYSVIESNYDYFITPFHEFIRHAMNGNIKFIEPLICESIYLSDELNLIFKNNAANDESGIQITSKNTHFLLSNLLEETKKFILLNYKKNLDAFLGLATNKKLNIIKDNYTSNTLIYKALYGYDIKEAINALRILFLAQNYLATGKIDFFVKNNDAYIEFEKIYIDIKNKLISKNDIVLLIESMIKNINNKKDKFLNKDYKKNFYFMESKTINQNNDNSDPIKIKEELEVDIQKSIENICKNNL